MQIGPSHWQERKQGEGIAGGQRVMSERKLKEGLGGKGARNGKRNGLEWWIGQKGPREPRIEREGTAPCLKKIKFREEIQEESRTRK